LNFLINFVRMLCSENVVVIRWFVKDEIT
jgi:hypothetical protein